MAVSCVERKPQIRFMVAVEHDLPACSNCGAKDYVAGVFEHVGQLFRCEFCNTCFKPSITLELTATIEPVPVET
jgi:hypothetical protein